MVSFHTLLPKMSQRKMSIDHVHESESNSKKRKWDDVDEAEEVLIPAIHRPWKSQAKASRGLVFDDVELHLQTPLPSEWQRCLDIQSGEIHFYNSRTQKRTVRDPRESREEEGEIEPSSPHEDCHMSLDLELNLPRPRSFDNYSSLSSPISEKNNPIVAAAKTKNFQPLEHHLFMRGTPTKQSTFSGAPDEAEVEMVATACMRCHMLVMLCKSSPTCPNCKFVHPPYQTPSDLFKPRLSLSC